MGVSYVTYVDLWAQRGIPFDERTLPFPSLADVGFLGFIPFAFAGILLLPPGIFRSAQRTKNAIDGMMVGIAMLLVAWVMLLRDLGHQDLGSPLATGLLLAYPYGDVLLIAAAICAWDFVPSEERDNLLLAVVGLGFLAMADLGFYVLVARDAVGISAINALWPAGFVLLSMAAVRPALTSPEPTLARPPTRALVPLSVAAGILAAGFAAVSGTADATLAALSTLLLGGLLVRWMHGLGDKQRARRIQGSG